MCFWYYRITHFSKNTEYKQIAKETMYYDVTMRRVHETTFAVEKH
jgi:hypothetical protein